ncbi:MAG: protein kinase [Anaerolineae bacterium]|nr:protein kinase [Anaerolineae bacterium]
MIIGRRFAGLEIVELVGLGAAAEVYRAVDAQGRTVAVKVLSERAEPGLVARFVREAQALVQLAHPNIVRMYAAGQEEGLRYIVMELMEGGSLKERLQREGRLEWQEAVRIAQEVARALAHAHDRQIVHRDVKPGNVLFSRDGQAKLTDFGLARLLGVSQMTRTGTVIGTVSYLSPEQAAGQHVDGRSDLYSLGVVLFEMVVGHPPFVGDSLTEVLAQHLHRSPPRPSTQVPDLPPALDALILRLLEKDPARRFPSAGELEEALAECLQRPFVSVAVPLSSERPRVLPLVGRKTELEILENALKRAALGRGTALLLAGEAGMGKTRLIHEVERLAEAQNALFLKGDCLYSDVPDPYAPFVEILRALERRYGFMLGFASEDDSSIVKLYREIAGILHLDASSPAPAWLNRASPLDAQAHVFGLMARFFGALAEQWSLVLVLDDMQWASPTALQLFHYLARDVEGRRVFLLGAYRPEDALVSDEGKPHPLRDVLRRMSREHLGQVLTLGPLDDADMEELAAAALGADRLDYTLVEFLCREAKGNPFYLLEMLRLLREQGLLQEKGGVWNLVSVPSEGLLPETIMDLIMRRVDRVEKGLRELLDWAAIGGYRLNVDLLSAILQNPPLTLQRQLYTLERDYALIVSDREGYQFSHPKVQQAIYESMPLPLRRQSHLFVGRKLEAFADTDPWPYVYDLARHFGLGGDEEKAYRYACLAAERAEAEFAVEEAVNYLQQALELWARVDLGHPAKRLALLHRRGKLLLLMGRAEGFQDLEDALELSREIRDVHAEACVLLDLGVAHGRRGRWKEALSFGEQSYQLAREIEDQEQQIAALLMKGFFLFESGSWQEALQTLTGALELAQGNELLSARLWGNLGIILDAQGEYERAIEYYQRSVETFARLQQPLDEGRGLNNLGFAFQRLGRYREARECYQQALERFQRVGDVHEQGVAYLHMAEVALAQGQREEAREHCRLANRLFEREGFSLGTADVYRVYAGIARQEGRWTVAERYLQEALGIYEEHGDRLNAAETHQEIGSLLKEMGEERRAEEELDRSRTIFQGLRGGEGIQEDNPGG